MTAQALSLVKLIVVNYSNIAFIHNKKFELTDMKVIYFNDNQE